VIATDWLLDTFVTGRPAPQGSKRHVGNGILLEQSKAVGPWRTLVAWHVAQEWNRSAIEGPVVLRLEFVMPRPSSCPKRSTPAAIKRPDWDKLSRAISDALGTAGVYRDDSQVVFAEITKRIAELDEHAGCRIQIAEVA
jgi:crossover junction endodeoxyribonuclease RusA